MFDTPTTTDEFDAHYGKRPFWKPPPQLNDRAVYIQGSAVFDAVLERSETVRHRPAVFVCDRGGGLEVQLVQGLGGLRIDVPHALVEAVALEDHERIVTLKEKSVVGRALVGTLFGPVGAIVGGMSGIGTKEVATMPDNLLTIWCSDGEAQTALVFSVANKHRAETERFMTRAYGDVFGAEPPVVDQSNEAKTSGAVLDQIERLAALHQQGALTD